jgi:DNA-binding SARP family transcriptional activator
MELLWPEQDPSITVKRLHVALASLRKTLEPGIVKGASAYLSRVGDSYRIDIGQGWVDIEAFSDHLRRARRENEPDESLGHLLEAESLYGGDFMEEEPYSEWCAEPRESLRKDYLSIVGQIVDHYKRLNQHARCIEFAEKYLAVDGYSESVYRTLMISYWKTGDKFALVRTYKRCRETVMRELDCALSEDTELLYRKLLKDVCANVC